MTLDIASDYEVVDNLQTISFYSKTAEGTWASAETVNNVLKRVTVKALSNNVSVIIGVFHVWDSQITAVPKANDKLTDAESMSWIVKDVNAESLNTRYRLTCTKAV